MLPASLVTGVMIVGDRCPMRACSAWVSDVDEVEMARYPLTSPKGELSWIAISRKEGGASRGSSAERLGLKKAPR
jgi:hypothetical protein